MCTDYVPIVYTSLAEKKPKLTEIMQGGIIKAGRLIKAAVKTIFMGFWGISNMLLEINYFTLISNDFYIDDIKCPLFSRRLSCSSKLSSRAFFMIMVIVPPTLWTIKYRRFHYRL